MQPHVELRDILFINHYATTNIYICANAIDNNGGSIQ
jgi:hypothetical protein